MQANKLRRLRLKTQRFDALARERLEVGTDYAVAVALGMHPANLSYLRSGRTQPGERFIVRALDALDCAFEDLFEIVDADSARR